MAQKARLRVWQGIWRVACGKADGGHAKSVVQIMANKTRGCENKNKKTRGWRIWLGGLAWSLKALG